MNNPGDNLKIKQAYHKTWQLLGKIFPAKFCLTTINLCANKKKSFLPRLVFDLQIYRDILKKFIKGQELCKNQYIKNQLDLNDVS